MLQQLELAILVDQGHESLFHAHACQKVIRNLEFHIHQGIAHAVHIVSFHACLVKKVGEMRPPRTPASGVDMD